MARRQTLARKTIMTLVAWAAAIVLAFPILWMILTSFKSEIDAFAMPPRFLFFSWTIENYAVVQERSNYLRHAMNSVILSGGSTLLALVIAIPAAWAMAFAP